MEIVTGKKVLPVKAILYGIEGIGKTTFASKWQKPLFIDVENGSWQMDVARVVPKTYSEFKDIVRQLTADSQDFKTLVIDSADWLEKMMVNQICQDSGIDSIEKYEKGYGKGWNKLAEDWGALLDRLDQIRMKNGVNILFVAHSKIKRFEPADDTGHDRYTLTMADKNADVLKKWSDLTLFVKYDTFTVEDGGKVKVQGGNKRVMFSRFHPCWDAKNRYGLPDKMPFEFEQIAGIFGKTPSDESDKPPATPDPKPEPASVPAIPPEPEGKAVAAQPTNPEQAELLAQVESLLKTSGIGYGELSNELEKKGVVPVGTPIINYNTATLRRIIAGWNAITNNINLHRGN